MLKLTTLPLNGGAMCPVVVDDGAELLLVDCGTAASMEELEQIAGLKGADLSRLTKIIITHHDHDHMGSLAAIKEKHPAVKVIASAVEKDYIEGRKKSIRLSQAERALETASEDERDGILARIAMLEAVRPAAVDIAVTGGEAFDWCGGVEIIASPGHMPGHISVCIRELQTLVAGDAMTMSRGMPQMANPAYTLDMDEAARSIEKFMQYDLMQVICYHGGVFTGDVASALAAVVAGYRQGR